MRNIERPDLNDIEVWWRDCKMESDASDWADDNADKLLRYARALEAERDALKDRERAAAALLRECYDILGEVEEWAGTSPAADDIAATAFGVKAWLAQEDA